jgi:hypothetical protein
MRYVILSLVFAITACGSSSDTSTTTDAATADANTILRCGAREFTDVGYGWTSQDPNTVPSDARVVSDGSWFNNYAGFSSGRSNDANTGFPADANAHLEAWIEANQGTASNHTLGWVQLSVRDPNGLVQETGHCPAPLPLSNGNYLWFGMSDYTLFLFVQDANGSLISMASIGDTL